nr:Nephrin [Halicryptus spinulosus]
MDIRNFINTYVVFLIGLFLPWKRDFVVGQQSFATYPENVTVIEGGEVLLRCRINNRQGPVQWAYDGRPFGHVIDYSLPGYPRYSMVVNDEQGQFDFRIAQASLPEDDAKFECQVLGNPPLRSAALVTVISPPEAPRIQGITNGTVVEMSPGESQNLTCISNNGKPAAVLKWMRNSHQITDNVWNEVTDVSQKRENAKSMLMLKPNKEDNGIRVACEAHSAALPSPLVTAFYLSVLYAPGPPSISGYTSGDIIRKGDRVLLICVSYDGNPLASLRWKKNGVPIDLSFFTLDRERLAKNPHNFTAQPSDNNAVMRCEAHNSYMGRRGIPPLFTEVRLKVRFHPETVKIIGKDDVSEGNAVNLTCVSSNSNPPAAISWIADGHKVRQQSDTQEESTDGGYITKSMITLTVAEKRKNVVVYCQAVNSALGKSTMTTKTLTVLYPPEQPTILGYSDGTSIRAEQVQRLICMVIDGNPLPKVSWYKGDVEQTENVMVTNDQNAVSSQITILVGPSDNAANYSCRASNRATKAPLVAYISLTVHFPPYSVDVSSDPAIATAGNSVKLLCQSASSNPAAEITWLRNGRLVAGSTSDTVEGLFGGEMTNSYMLINLTEADDQSVITCRAKNQILEHTAYQDVTLNVQYKPVFSASIPTSIDVIEGAPLIVNYSAKGNPLDITYKWKKDGDKFTEIKGGLGEDHIHTENHVFKIFSAYKNDTGEYMLVGKNSVGSTSQSIKINVMFPAKVIHTTAKVTVKQGETAALECRCEGNPLPETIIAWSRENYDMSRAQITPGDNSVLTIPDVTKDDAGMFVCNAFNGIGEHSAAHLDLVVQFRPIIDQSPRFAKSASENGETARLLCIAQGHPDVSFVWTRGGARVNRSLEKFDMEFRKYDSTHYESILLVHTVTPIDYGEYTCMAQNALGTHKTTVRLMGTSRPDPPYAVTVVEKTFNSIKLTWTAGFDGGLRQVFRVRYRQATAPEVYHYIDVHPSNATEFNIPGLERNSVYQLSVMAYNKLGDSGYQTEEVTAKTASEIPAEEGILGIRRGSTKMPILLIVAISVAGAILLAINIMLIIYFVRYRKGKEDDDVAASETKSNTVEMYSHVDDLTRDDVSERTYADQPAPGSRSFYLDDANLENVNIYQGGSPTYKTFRETYASTPPRSPYGATPPRSPAVTTDFDFTDALHRQQHWRGKDPYMTYSRLQGSQGNVSLKRPVTPADRIRLPPAPPARSTSQLGDRHGKISNHMIATLPTQHQPRYGPDPTSMSRSPITAARGRPSLNAGPPEGGMLPRSMSTIPYSYHPDGVSACRSSSANPYSTRPSAMPPSPPLVVRPLRTNPRVTPRAYDYVDVSEESRPTMSLDILV